MFPLCAKLVNLLPPPKKKTKCSVIDQGSLLLLPHILTLDMNSEDFLPAEFWAAFVQRFQNDGLETIFTPIIKAIVATIRTTNLLGNYQAPINVRSLGDSSVAFNFRNIHKKKGIHQSAATQAHCRTRGPTAKLDSKGCDRAHL